MNGYTKTIVLFAALIWPNLAAADEEPHGGEWWFHIIHAIDIFCHHYYGENNHVDLLPQSASKVQQFCAYASHPDDDIAALCRREFGDNPPSDDPQIGKIQRLCSKLQQSTKHEQPPKSPLIGGGQYRNPWLGASRVFSLRQSRRLQSQTLPKLWPYEKPQLKPPPSMRSIFPRDIRRRPYNLN